MDCSVGALQQPLASPTFSVPTPLLELIDPPQDIWLENTVFCARVDIQSDHADIECGLIVVQLLPLRVCESTSPTGGVGIGDIADAAGGC